MATVLCPTEPQEFPSPLVAERNSFSIAESPDPVEMVAVSPAMRQLRARIESVADVEVPLLLLGESGVGKEVVARLIHRLSPRRHRTFLKVNCAALPGDLMESELFGYEPGAFTGATRSKPGKFELCNKGTIFLDEIGELPTHLQAKLLQVLEDQQFTRLGGRNTIRVDVRIVAATNIDMQQALETHRFRKDLYYRLNAVTFHLPPLRERSEEILPLMAHFRTTISRQLGRPPISFRPEIVEACLRYSWPGNVRELQNFIKRYLILGDTEDVLSDLCEPQARIEEAAPNLLTFPSGEANANMGLKAMVRRLKAQAETKAIQDALNKSQWNRHQAAHALGISGKALAHKMQQYGIDRPVNEEQVPPDTSKATKWLVAQA